MNQVKSVFCVLLLGVAIWMMERITANSTDFYPDIGALNGLCNIP